MVKKIVSIALLLAMVANLVQPIYAANLVAIPQNVRPPIFTPAPVQTRPTELSFKDVETKISNVFKPEKENAKLQAIFSGTCGDNVTWSLDTTTGVLTISGSGAMTMYDGHEKTPWRLYEKYIKIVIIENGVTSISNNAFHLMPALTDVAISESVSFIGELAFTFCSCLASITVKQSNQNYKSENGVLFDKSGTRLIQYPCGKSGEYTISSSVKSIDGYAFTACLGVTSINVDLNNPNYKSKDGVLFNKDGSTLIQYPSGKIERSYIVPDFASIINYYSFCPCDKLRSVVIPATVTSIKYGAFEWHNLASLCYEGLVNPGNFDVFGRRTVPEVYVPWNYKDDNFCGLSVSRSPAPSQTPMRSRSLEPTLTPTQTQDSTTTVGFEKWFIDNAAWMVPAFSIAVSAIGLLLKYDDVKNFCSSHCHCCHKESETTETGTLDEKLL